MSGSWKKNMGAVDRLLRAVVGIGLGVLCLSGAIGNVLALVLGTVAVVLLVTSVAGTCPLYSVLGISTGGDRTESPRPAH